MKLFTDVQTHLLIFIPTKRKTTEGKSCMKLITDVQTHLLIFAHQCLSDEEIETLDQFLSEDPMSFVRGQDEEDNYYLNPTEISQAQNYAWDDSEEDQFLQEFFKQVEEEINNQNPVYEITLYLRSEKSSLDL